MSTSELMGLVSDNRHAQLAADLATQLRPLQDILRSHSMSEADLQVLLKDPQFRHQVKSFQQEWHSPMSAVQRVRAKAAIVVEDGIMTLHGMFHDATILPSARLDAYGKLVELADMKPKPAAKNSEANGNRFNLTLNLGGDQQLTIAAEVPSQSDDADDADIIDGDD